MKMHFELHYTKERKEKGKESEHGLTKSERAMSPLVIYLRDCCNYRDLTFRLIPTKHLTSSVGVDLLQL